MRYVVKRPKLKQRIQHVISRMPFIYRWAVERRTRQIRADFLKSWLKQGSDPTIQVMARGTHLSGSTVKSVDEVLEAIRQEIKQTHGTSDAG